MARYIDADKIDFSPLKNEFDKARAKIIVMGQPTADVVEVVRCKDCKHRIEGAKMCAHPKAIGWDAIEPEDDDFCSYGERRETK